MHSAVPESKLDRARAFAWKNRRVITLAAIAAVPVASRVFPEFPADEVMSALRLFLGMA